MVNESSAGSLRSVAAIAASHQMAPRSQGQGRAPARTPSRASTQALPRRGPLRSVTMGSRNHPSGSSGRTVTICLRALIRRRVVAAEKGGDCLDHPAMVLRQTITMPQRMIQRLEGRRAARNVMASR